MFSPHRPNRARRRIHGGLAAALLLCAGTVLIAPRASAAVNISGTIHHDTDAMLDGTIDGSGIGALGAFGPLYVTALAAGQVAGSAMVAADGSYSIDGLPDGAYLLQLSRYDESARLGSPAGSGPAIPADWQFTAEGVTVAGDGAADGVIAIDATTASANFGVRQTDTDGDGTADIAESMPATCWDTEFLGDGQGLTATSARTWIMHSGGSGPVPQPSDAYRPRNTSNFARIGGSILDVGDLTQGPGLTLTHNVAPASHTVTDVAATTLAQAKANGEYFQYTFATDSDFALAYIDWVGFLNRIDQEAFGVGVAIAAGTEPFIDLTGFDEALNDGGAEGRENTKISPYALAHATSYTVRYYFYDVAGAIDFDDPYIAFDVCPFTSISGTVFHDSNGDTNAVIDGAGTPTAGTSPLYITLVDQAGVIVASVPVATDGSYLLDGVVPGDYSLQLGTVDLSAQVGSGAPGPDLPSGWQHTAEDCCGAGSDGTADGSLAVAVDQNLTNANFGIQQPPTAGPATSPEQLNPGGSNQVQVPTLTPTDPEDGAAGVVIDTLPGNATLYYNGDPVSAGQLIPDYDPALLTIDPDDGAVTVTFGYSALDDAGASSPTALVTMPFAVGGIEVIKSVSGINDIGTPGLIEVGDEVIYSFQVTNTGTAQATGVAVTDPLVTVSGGPITLAPGATDSTTFTAVYEITAADVERGGIENVAMVSATASGVGISDTSDAGTDASGDPVADPAEVDTASPLGIHANTSAPDDDPTTFLIAHDPRLSLVKSVADYTDTNGNRVVDSGDVIHYSFEVSNIGNVDITTIQVTDVEATVAGSTISLAAGQTDSTTFSASHTIDAGDIAAGGVENSATVAGLHDGLPVTDVSDTGTDPDGDGIANPGALDTPSPLGFHPNTADTRDDPTTFLIAADPRLEVIKSVDSHVDADSDGAVDEGESVTYTFSVANTGNTPITGIDLADPTATVSGGPIDLDPGQSDSTTFTATHLITMADILAGGVENVATATGLASGTPVSFGSDAGTDPDGDPVTDPLLTNTASPLGVNGNSNDPDDDPTTFVIEQITQLVLIKSVTGVTDATGNGVTDAGDVIHYAFTVSNGGNVALSNVRIEDPLAVVTGGPVTLQPHQADSTSFTGSHEITRADLDLGGVENSAQALADFSGHAVTDTSDTGTGVDGGVVDDPGATQTLSPLGLNPNSADDGDDPTTYIIEFEPRLELIKSVAGTTDANGNGRVDAGDAVNYVFRVTNTGNIPLTVVTVTDGNAVVSGGPIDLDIGASDTGSFTATHEITADDVAAGGVENVAVASADADGPAGGLTTSDSSDAGTGPAGDVISDPGREGTDSPLGLNPNTSDFGDDPTTFLIGDAPGPQPTSTASPGDQGTGTGGLSVTGADGWLVLVAAALVIAGGVVLAARRRRGPR
ncbi:MAG: beta strand repeat-containing protein [Beutenbergiaceae bacterium]